MSKNEDSFINSRNEYLKLFKDSHPKDPEKTSIQEKALDEAIKIRHQEGDRYWTRATFFWALTTVMFTGYFILERLSVLAPDKKFPEESFVFISCIGFLLSFGGYLANRGARFWLSNYECQVHLLEDEIIGSLFKTFSNEIINNKGKETHCSHLLKIGTPLASYPFSVTKIHLILNLFLTTTWLILVIKSLIDAKVGFGSDYEFTSTSAIVLSTIFFFFILLYSGRSSREKTRPIRITKIEYK